MTEFRYRKTTQQQTESINLFREGMIYRFLKTGRFRRILFLVDRTALGEQASDVFREAKLEDLMTLNEIYSIKGLEDKDIDRETRIQIATVQSMGNASIADHRNFWSACIQIYIPRSGD